MRWFLGFLLLGVGLLSATPVVDGIVNESEGYTLVATNPENTDKAGADLLSFYYAIANDSLFLAITTQNSASWGVAYGFVLDCVEGGYSGLDNIPDSWGRKIAFDGWYPDYEIYFWYDGNEQVITSNNINKYIGGDGQNYWERWQYNFTTEMRWAANYGGSSGLQSLEVAVPLEALGNPQYIKSVVFIAGGDNSSAVDILPYDSSVSLIGDGEWTDWDTVTTYFVLSIPERPAKLVMQPVLNGVRLTGSGEFMLEVYSVDGKLVTRRKVRVNGTETVEFRLKPGMYLVKEATGKAQKFIVAR
ncbi:MAG: T9SS type A sorting domain-containing protein [candidate division WOR-3 bacterium]